MPDFDETGPAGAGPRTGRGAGDCPPDQGTSIKKLYRDAGFTAPKGKGIHTDKFHRCVVDVMKKIKAGKMKAGSDPHAICMASLGADGAVKAEHRKSKVAKAMVAASQRPFLGRRTSGGQSKLQLLLDGLTARVEMLDDQRNFYIAEIWGYADQMKRGDWNNKYAVKLIEHANELGAIIAELETNKVRQQEIRSKLQLEDLQAKFNPAVDEVVEKQGP